MNKVSKPVCIALIFCFTLIFSLTSSTNVYAVGLGNRLVSQQETIVPQGTIDEDAVVLGHDVNVVGTVSEILVVVNGNVHLASSAKAGIIVDIGGTVTQDNGAVTEGIYQFSLSSYFWNGVLFGVSSALFVWIGMLAFSITVVLLSVLFSLVLRARIKVPLGAVDRSVRRTGLIGLFVTFATIAVCAIFSMVDIGISLAVLIFLTYVLAGIIGFSIVSVWIGKLILQSKDADKPTWVQSLIGASAIMMSANIPVIGLILFFVFWFIGIGAMTVWAPNLWRRK